MTSLQMYALMLKPKNQVLHLRSLFRPTFPPPMKRIWMCGFAFFAQSATLGHFPKPSRKSLSDAFLSECDLQVIHVARTLLSFR